MKIRDGHKSLDRHKSLSNETEYKYWRNKVTVMIRKVKQEKYQTYTEANKGNPGSIYKLFQEAGAGKGSRRQSRISSVNTDEKYSSVFRENRCPPPPKPVYGGNFSHEAVTLKIRSRSPKSNMLLILSDLYRLTNLATFHPMI